MLPALGWGERGMGKQLLLIRHRLQQGGQIGVHPRGSPTKARKAFPLLRHHPPTGQETQRLSQRRTGPETHAQQQPTARDGHEATNVVYNFCMQKCIYEYRRNKI